MTTAESLSLTLELPDALIASLTSTVNTYLAPLYVPFSRVAAPYTAVVEQSLDGYLPRSTLSTKLPMMTVTPVLFSLVGYAALLVLFFLFSRVYVSRYTLLSVIHNTLMVGLSLYMAVGIAVTASACGITGWNNAVGTSDCDRRLAKLIWLFYFSKVLEFMDTFLMLLKGNYRQVTFLHVYHHISVFLIWFVTTRWGPGGETYWSATSNSAVHVVMYSYYLLMTLFKEGRVRSFLQRRKYAITYIQMLQFAVNIAQSVFDLYVIPRDSLKYPAALLHVLLWYMVTLLLLFYNYLSNDRARGVTKKKVLEYEQSRDHGRTRALENASLKGASPKKVAAPTALKPKAPSPDVKGTAAAAATTAADGRKSSNNNGASAPRASPPSKKSKNTDQAKPSEKQQKPKK